MVVESPQYIRQLTGLRGIAALWVALYHIRYGLHFAPQFFDDYLKNRPVGQGYLGVDIFFMLSGFVMALAASTWDGARVRVFAWSFLQNRFARIYPLHLLTLSVMVLILCLKEHRMPGLDWIESLIGHLSLTNAWGKWYSPDWNYPSWSISAEWLSYMLFPFLLPFNRKAAKSYISLIPTMAMAGALLIYVAHFKKQDVFDLTWDWGWLRCLCEFWIGMGLYHIKVREQGRFTPFRSNLLVFLSLGSLALFLILNIKDGWILPIAALIVFSNSLQSTFSERLFGGRVLHYLGQISYGIYMWHVPVGVTFMWVCSRYLVVSGSNWVGFAGVITAMGLVIGVSALTYHFVEKPVRAWLVKPTGS